jgi:glycosyltransferase involved in cell wall biosynthesis
MLGWIKGLQESGKEVKVFVERKSALENYSLLTPDLIDSSTDSYLSNFSLLSSPKQLLRLYKRLLEEKPSLIILRIEMNLRSLIILFNVLLSRFTFVIYLQWPIKGLIFPKRVIRRMLQYFLRVPFISPVKSYDLDWAGNDPKIGRAKRDIRFIPFSISEKPKIREIRKKTGNSLKFISVGKYVERKQQLQLVHSVLNNKEFIKSGSTLDIFGEISNDEHRKTYSELKDFLTRFDLEKRVKLHHNVSNIDLLGQLYHFDAFILISKHEPASFSQIEAMSFGLPIIIKAGNGTANYLKHGCGGFIVRDSIELDLAITRIIEVTDFRRNCDVVNRDTILSLCNPRLTAEAIISLQDYV